MTRNYNLTDLQLIQVSDQLINVAQEDLTDLIPYGITPAMLQKTRQKRDNFLDLESDIVWRGRLKSITQQKAKARKQLHKAIKDLMLHVSIKIGNNSPEYQHFGTANLARQTDHQLLRTAKTVISTANEYQSLLNLPTDAMSQPILCDHINQYLRLFEEKIDDQQNAIRHRDFATQSRCRLGNSIYHDLAIIAKVGKAIFAEDPAHANDYRLIPKKRAKYQKKSKSKSTKYNKEYTEVSIYSQ